MKCSRCLRPKKRGGSLCAACYMAEYRADPIKGEARRRANLELVLKRQQAQRAAGVGQLTRNAWDKLRRELDRLDREDLARAAPADPAEYESNVAIVLERQRRRACR